MEIETLIQFAGVAVGTATLVFGFVKWRDAQIHGRITELKIRLEKDIDHIKSDYAKRSEIDHHIRSMENILSEMKQEQHRMTERMDDFIKWIMENVKKE